MASCPDLLEALTGIHRAGTGKVETERDKETGRDSETRRERGGSEKTDRSEGLKDRDARERTEHHKPAGWGWVVATMMVSLQGLEMQGLEVL